MRFFCVPAVILGSVLLGSVAIPVDHQRTGLQSLNGYGPEVDALTDIPAIPSTRAPTLHLESRARPRTKRPATTKKRPNKTNKPKKEPKSIGKKKKATKKKPKPHTTKTSHKPAKPTSTPKPEEYWKQPIPSEAQIAQKCRVPRNKALFWSGTSAFAHDYAKLKGLTTDSNAYPGPTKKLPVRYTYMFRGKDAAKSQEFANRFSRVFAKKASGTVYLMVPWKTGPNRTRVFHKDEWPQLKKGLQTGRVTKIVQVNPDDFDQTKEYNPKEYGLSKRAAEIDLDNLSWDVDLDALEEAWRTHENRE